MPPGAQNFAANLLNGLASATGDLLVFVEDDDFYAPTHVASLAELAERGHPIVGSEPVQRYYNAAHRCFRLMDNRGASMCQTAIGAELKPVLERVIRACSARNSFGIDADLWTAVGRRLWAFTGRMSVVGMKGLPGRVGLGVGHRPDARWERDPKLARLRAWIGPDAECYAPFEVPRVDA